MVERVVKKIIVLQTAFVGDLLLSIPLLKRIHEIFPDAEVDLVCRKGLGAMMKEFGLISRFFEIDKSRDKRVSGELLCERYDLLVSPHQSFRSALLARRINATEKVGYFNWWNFWAFNRRVKRPMDFPEALRQLALVAEMDSETKEFFDELKSSELKRPEEKAIPSWASMSVEVSSENLKEDLRTELFSKPVCFLAPGSVWNTKRWTVEGFAGVASHFIDKGMNVCIVGAPGEESVCNEVLRRVPEAKNLCGRTTLFEMYRLFCEGQILVCNDSGAMHMAAVADLPTVSVFGPTTLDLGYRPWQNRALVVENDLSCRPCGKHGSRECPIGTHECMKNVSADEVIQATTQLIGKTP